jgi:hypothetical protein
VVAPVTEKNQPAISRRVLAVVAAGVAVALILVIAGLVVWRSDDANPSASDLQAQGRAAEAASKTVANCVRYTEGANAVGKPGGDPSKANYFDHGTGGAVTLTAEDYCQQMIAIENSDPSASHTGFIIVNGRVARAPAAP